MKKLMKQAQQMQKMMEEMDEKMKETIIDVSVGGGMVTVKMNGKYDVVDIKISEEILKNEEPNIVMDLLKSAFNEAKNKVEQLNKEEMGKLTGGFGLPGNLGF
ncbi:MAG: YbaB/EbfC family nucleoid-associated protein [bacterium]|nr:MAG: Nucleoid-associated protein [candidate division TA06 bacterium 32_111]KUK87262.1 MAG: Nucleoid-associated protein [candidate division TA06 bacterium 34_109]MDI6700480.1 YbaB/EbfC family nucleoid-associated protein [bacterium]